MAFIFSAKNPFRSSRFINIGKKEVKEIGQCRMISLSKKTRWIISVKNRRTTCSGGLVRLASASNKFSRLRHLKGKEISRTCLHLYSYFKL